jgi:acyl-CoA synthetase (AMP-forming)/AMP-acid ligase II
MLSTLLDHVERRGPAAVRSLRSIAYGAAPMPLAVLRRAATMLTVDFAQGYGMTELSGNAVFLGPDEHRRGLAGDTWLLGAAGRPGPGVSVRVVDDDLGDVPVGEPGEIVVRGDQVMAGYWSDPAMTADALHDGWFRTGDVGRFDGEGWLYVVDRKKDVIVSGGENISSRQVEEVLHQDPAVKEIAVVGVPDPRWGVCAVVVPWPGQTIDGDALVRRAREVLAGFKVPRHVVIVEELPKNAAGKVVKADLRAWLASDPGARGPRR